MITVAPGSTASLVSLTVPVIVLALCARAATASETINVNVTVPILRVPDMDSSLRPK